MYNRNGLETKHAQTTTTEQVIIIQFTISIIVCDPVVTYGTTSNGIRIDVRIIIHTIQFGIGLKFIHRQGRLILDIVQIAFYHGI